LTSADHKGLRSSVRSPFYLTEHGPQYAPRAAASDGTGALALQWDETSPVDDKTTKVSFKFTGKPNKLTLSIERRS
jgi:hypothetical protein